MSPRRSAVVRRARMLPMALAALVLAGCNADSDPVQPAEEQAAEVEAGETDALPDDVDDSVTLLGTDALQWEPAELTVNAGLIAFELQCEPNANHNVVIIETGQEIAVCAPGETGTGTIELEPGEYTFVCTVPGHSGTMRGPLTVVEP